MAYIGKYRLFYACIYINILLLNYEEYIHMTDIAGLLQIEAYNVLTVPVICMLYMYILLLYEISKW